MSYSCFADYYDNLMSDVDYEALAHYILAILERFDSRPECILDVACGTGSLSVCLAKRGYEMVCCDQSCEMLTVAREKGQGLDMLFLAQSMEGLDLYGTVGCAVCTLDSINHIVDPKRLATGFKKVSLFLEPGGLFIFDVNTPYKHKNILADNTFIYETHDVMCVWQNLTDSELLTHIRLDFFERVSGNNYTRKQESFTERAYSFQALEQMLADAGLELLDIYGENSFSSPAPDCQRAVFVARKI